MTFFTKQVDVFVSRNLDSRFNEREIAGVKECQEKLCYSLHVMRDHPLHGFDLLGGGWGGDLTRTITQSDGSQIYARLAWKNSWENILKDWCIHSQRETKGHDQDIISRYDHEKIFVG